MYYIGIDGGGTSTKMVAIDENMTFYRYELGDSASFLEYGMDAVIRRMRETALSLLPDSGDTIGGIAAGIPCYGESKENDALLERELADAFPAVPVYLTNDVEAGWAGSLGLREGINVVSGTGSIGFGVDRHGRTARSGGWDETYSDEGSCYWIGVKTLSLFTRQSDGRMPRGALHTILREKFGLQDDMDFIDHVRQNYLISRKKVAGLQRITQQAALAGDPGAKFIYEEAAQELFLIANSVRKKLSFPDKGWPVSYSGGLFKSGDLILRPFSDRISASGGKVSKPLYEPVHGAALLAVRHFLPQKLEEAREFLTTKP